MAPPIDTRLGPGTLKLGAPLVDYGPQISNVLLEPSQDEEDGTPTLGDPDPLPEITESWVLTGEAVQDFEEPAGLVNYCFDNALTVVAFEWVPNTPAGVKWTGDVLITALPIGGDVAVQNTSAFSFAVQGVPTRVDPPAAPLNAARKAREARGKRRELTAKRTSSSVELEQGTPKAAK
jgi:hypothetical protein